jgi:hypothetical protein
MPRRRTLAIDVPTGALREGALPDLLRAAADAASSRGRASAARRRRG